MSLASTSVWGAQQEGAPSLASVARILQPNHKPRQAKNVVVLAGAGISTASGIPDFRSPDTGLYANLKKYNLPYPEAIFDIDYFRDKPQAFFTLSKELYPGTFKPTLTHCFFKLLHDKQQLLRVFTQNIDTLERIAGLPADKIVEAHGSFASSQCIRCKHKVDPDWMRQKCMAGEVAHCQQPACLRKTSGKGGLVKPDIVFFGEGLPDRFFALMSDLKKADLLIVLGTSLQVHPFASLVNYVRDDCPRVLINLERVGEIASYSGGGGRGGGGGGGMQSMFMNETGFDFEGWTLAKGKGKEHIRDVFWQGKCDEGVLELAEALGWKNELKAMHKDVCRTIDGETKDNARETETPAPEDKSLNTAAENAKTTAREVASDANVTEAKANSGTHSDEQQTESLLQSLDRLKVGDSKGTEYGKSTESSSQPLTNGESDGHGKGSSSL